MADLTNETILHFKDDAVAVSLEGEAVILDVASGTYFGLEGVGAFVCDRLQTPTTFGELVRSVVDVYEVDEPTCKADLVTLIADLRRAGLVSVGMSSA